MGRGVRATPRLHPHLATDMGAQRLPSRAEGPQAPRRADTRGAPPGMGSFRLTFGRGGVGGAQRMLQARLLQPLPRLLRNGSAASAPSTGQPGPARGGNHAPATPLTSPSAPTKRQARPLPPNVPAVGDAPGRGPRMVSGLNSHEGASGRDSWGSPRSRGGRISVRKSSRLKS